MELIKVKDFKNMKAILHVHEIAISQLSKENKEQKIIIEKLVDKVYGCK
jgi:hypothetical protein